MYDLIIIGGGPAGITAGVYAARKKMNFLIITGDIGGQTLWTNEIENYTGFQLITGPDLVAKFQDQMAQYNVKINEGEKAADIKKNDGTFAVVTDKSTYETKTIVIASGKKPRELNVPGEAKYKNKGVVYCATCDGPLFAGKDVAVVGGGNSALDAGLQMTKIARQVYLINVAPKITGDPIMQDNLKKNSNVTILNDAQVTEVVGDKFVTGIKIKEKGKEKLLAVQGVFVEIGLIPNSGFARIVEKNKLGEIIIDCSAKTSVNGIFAAGDVTSVPDKQIIIAAGEGAKAVLSAYRYLNLMKST